jgi:hypothetical protein
MLLFVIEIGSGQVRCELKNKCRITCFYHYLETCSRASLPFQLGAWKDASYPRALSTDWRGEDKWRKKGRNTPKVTPDNKLVSQHSYSARNTLISSQP